MIKNNFIAVDFETAQPPWKSFIPICQIGIVVVENGEITEKISYLVKPPNNKYDITTVSIHKISPEMTADKPTFDLVWKQIEKHFLNTVIIAHNAYSFDEKVLWQNFNYYGINPKGVNKFIDTIYLFPGQLSLDTLCYGFGINCSKHHDALFDAECCANIYLKFLNGEFPDYNLINEYVEDTKPQNYETKKNNTSDYFRSLYKADEVELKKIKWLNKDEFSDALNSEIFKDKRVVITGKFNCISKDDLKGLVEILDGKCSNSISKSTDFVIIGGEPGATKVDRINKLTSSGHQITCINESQLEQIISLVENEKRN